MGQDVPAIMNHTTSNVETLQADDEAGIHALYPSQPGAAQQQNVVRHRLVAVRGEGAPGGQEIQMSYCCCWCWRSSVRRYGPALVHGDTHDPSLRTLEAPHGVTRSALSRHRPHRGLQRERLSPGASYEDFAVKVSFRPS